MACFSLASANTRSIAFVACVVLERAEVLRLQADFGEVSGTTQGKTAILFLCARSIQLCPVVNGGHLLPIPYIALLVFVVHRQAEVPRVQVDFGEVRGTTKS